MKRGLVMGSAVLAMLLCTATAFAGGDPNYVLSLSPAASDALPGDAYSVSADLDSSLGGDVQGWSFGVCSDPGYLTVDGASLGATASTAKNGSPPDFAELATFANGATCGVVICFTGCATLAPGAGSELLVVDYTVAAGAAPGTSTTIAYCSTLGTPPVSTVVVVGGASIPPATSDATLTIPDPNSLYASTSTGLLGGTVDSTVGFDSVVGGAYDAAQVSLSYDSAVVGLNSVANTIGAEFFDVQPTTAGELVVGLVMDTSDPLTAQIPAGANSTLFTVTWDALAVGSSALAFVDGLGSPGITNGLFAGQGSLYQPTLTDGAVTVVNYKEFLRSDCNNDNLVNIADGVYGLNYLFQGGPAPTCDDACDSNDDATIDAADMIYIFNYQFLDGPAPTAPYPTADLDPTNGDGLGCDGDADDL